MFEKEIEVVKQNNKLLIHAHQLIQSHLTILFEVI